MKKVTQAKGESIVEVKVTGREKEKMQKLIDAGVYLSFSDFLRSAIRDKLEEIKTIKVKNVDRKEAKKKIISYYTKFKEAYPSDVADGIELDYDLVFEITEELRKEGRLGFADVEKSTFRKSKRKNRGDENEERKKIRIGGKKEERNKEGCLGPSDKGKYENDDIYKISLCIRPLQR